jgi:hypothetical protein
VQWSRRWFSIFAETTTQSTAESRGFQLSGGQGLPHGLKIPGDLRFLILNLGLRI